MKGLLITYLLTYGGSVASLFNPFVGLLIYTFFGIVKPEATWSWAVPPGSYSRTIALALLVGWMVQGFGDWRFGRGRAIVGGLLGFWVLSVVGAAMAPNGAMAWHFVEQLTKIVLPILVGITTIDTIRKLKQLAWVIMLSQGYLAFEANLSYYRDGFNIIRELGMGGMTDNNAVAIAMDTGIGLAFFLGMQAAKGWQKALAFGSAALMAHSVLLSFSRGGMIGLIIVAFATFLLIPKQPKHYLLFLIAVLLVLRLAGKDVRERFGTSFAEGQQRDDSAHSRVELWKACGDIMCRRPLFGVGPDHFPLVASEYGFNQGKEAHSLWMQTGAELGIPALFCLLTYYGCCIVRLWPFSRERSAVPDPWLREAARMVIASLVGFMVSAQFVTLEGLEIPYYVALLGAGLLKVSSTSNNNRGVGILAGPSTRMPETFRVSTR
jgi:probable O-glycosylation ligase (exosortase A-associated)